MTKEFYSNGKLLLTGEYAVLDGALSLATPTKQGQSMTINEIPERIINWISYDNENNIWFSCIFDCNSMEILNKREKKSKDWLAIVNTLQSILKETKRQNKTFLNQNYGYQIETRLSFPRNWGLGSSSTLINNVAVWANVNPYILLENTMGGSGYDIACAQNNFPIFYQKKEGNPFVEITNFNPPFKENLFFIHLNKKQNSRDAIISYRECSFDKAKLVKDITLLTKQIANCKSLPDFESLITTHEELLSKTLKTPTVKDLLFSDYKSSIKSLGGWGGDFVLATGNKECISYFKTKGYPTVINYTDIIK